MCLLNICTNYQSQLSKVTGGKVLFNFGELSVSFLSNAIMLFGSAPCCDEKKKKKKGRGRTRKRKKKKSPKNHRTKKMKKNTGNLLAPPNRNKLEHVT